MKAVFGGAVKKPLMTKVSMRHLNEIVRERNQYSRDAMEAWQDFINLKGRMDMDLSKVTKRNNFLVEELESWKQQVSLICSPLGSLSDGTHSSSNSRRSQNNLPRRRKTSRSKSRRINVRTAALHLLLISRKTTPHALLYVYLAQRGSATTLSKLSLCNKKWRRNWSERESVT